MFYNTIHEQEPQLSKSQAQTEAQDAMVLKFFQDNPYKQLTALELADELNILFTSVRRSVTNLIKDEKLKYCGMKDERYGKPNHLICLKVEIGQQSLNL